MSDYVETLSEDELLELSKWQREAFEGLAPKVLKKRRWADTK